MHRTMASVAIDDGLLIAADFSGLVHCLDAQSGKVHWTHDLMATISAPPLIVDGKAYLTDQDGDVSIFALSKDKRLIAKHPIGDSVFCAPVFANGALYVATEQTLLAIASEESVPDVAATGGNWPQWRGPNRDNVSTETGLLKEWPEGGPPLVWRAEGIGEGIACLSIAQGRIYTMGYHEQGEFLTALDQHTGQRVWATRVGPRVEENRVMRWVSQRSPTVDGERLYAITTAGRLVCLQTKDGGELWSKSYPDDFGALHPMWGFCDYPLVDGEKLICTPGGTQASVVALDKRTGEEIWRTAIADGGRAAYAAVVAAEAGGVRQYIVFLQRALVAVRASDGELLWSYDKIANGVVNSHTPTVRGDRLLVTSGYNTGVALLKLIGSGEKFEAQEQYFERAPLNGLQDGSVLFGEHLYASGTGVNFCLEWTNGQRVWIERRSGRGSAAVIYADQRLYVHQSDGRVTLADVSPAGFQERGHFTLPDYAPSIGVTSPVIAGGRLYLRDSERLFCYDVTEGSSTAQSSPPRTIVLPKPDLVEPSARDRRTPRVGINRAPDAVFVPTPPDVVERMLKLASIEKQDVVYDLGSGDGRIVIAAAKTHGVQAVGVEIDPELIKLSQQRVQESKLADLVTIRHEDMFQVDLSQADVVAVFLYPRLLERLRPQFAKMKPGSRIVSHQFPMPDVEPDRVITLESSETGDRHTLYLWTTPLKAAPAKPE